MKIVEITWIDAHRKDGWVSDIDIKNWDIKEADVKQVGFLLSEDKNWLVFAMGIGEDKTYLNVHKIPKGMIKKRRIISGA